MREFEDGHYWVQVSSDSESEVALHDHGCWRLYGQDEPMEIRRRICPERSLRRSAARPSTSA
jgi:hypothetical protein